MGTTKDARADFDFELAAGIGGQWLRQMPQFTVREVETVARLQGEGQLRAPRSLFLMGPHADLALTLDDRTRIPLIGVAAYWAVGSYDTSITSFDGSIAHVRPWSYWNGDILLPGIGRRWKLRRNMIAATIRTGMSFASAGGNVAAAREFTPLDLTARSFLVQAEIEACRRLDPTTRVCFIVMPRIYDHEFMNGVTFGLRMEWGR